MEYAVSKQGMEETKAFFRRSYETENKLALLHARMDQARKRKSLLAADGPSCREKEALLSRMAEMEQEILADYHALLQVEGEIRRLIQKLPDGNHRALLEMHYLHHLSFLALAEKMHMDERHAYRVFKKAVQMASLHRMAEKSAK